MGGDESLLMMAYGCFMMAFQEGYKPDGVTCIKWR